jgi:hypothetical protein
LTPLPGSLAEIFKESIWRHGAIQTSRIEALKPLLKDEDASLTGVTFFPRN